MIRSSFRLPVSVPTILGIACLVVVAACSRESSVPDTATGPASPNNVAPTADRNDEHPGEQSLAVPEPQLEPDELTAGWIQLFDGHTLFGWVANTNANWTVSDGVIQADAGDPGLLLTTVPFADFEFRCDFRLEQGGNSGVFLRTQPEFQDPATDCYEWNICDSHETYPTGSLVGRERVAVPLRTEGNWNALHVRAENNKFVIQLNGKQILDFTDESAAPLHSGYIGLQKKDGKIEFRNVCVRPLGTQPLFNGADLTGWQVVPGCQSQFTVKDGAIHVTNGPGFLETEHVWDDFVMQFEARTNGDSLNSGVFFRAMTGTEEAPSNGYEAQIHNGFQNGNRAEPADAGTGAIFRRTKARWVIPNDREWFTMTLAAHGTHIATWVNGIAVTDWTDDRELDENPRRGLRTEAGHISLQGHDPTTDLDFRNLRIVASPKP